MARFSDRVTPVYEVIREKVQGMAVVGTNETGIKVNVDKHWFWTWQNELLAYIAHFVTRGNAAIEAYFPSGSPGPPWSMTGGGRRRRPCGTPPDLPAPAIEAPELSGRKVRRPAVGRKFQEIAP